jgi:hypothetical protein
MPNTYRQKYLPINITNRICLFAEIFVKFFVLGGTKENISYLWQHRQKTTIEGMVFVKWV